MKLQTLLNKALIYKSNEQLLAEKEEGRQSFLKRFPFASLIDLTIDEFSNTKTKDCFNYWLERKKILGGIGGGNSSKFGIYLSKTGDYCKGYGKQKIELKGEQLNKEFQSLKERIIKAIKFAEEDHISDISSLEVPVFNMVLLKILNIYIPDKFLNIYSPPILIELGKELNINDALLASKYSIELNHEVLIALKKQDVFSSWSNEEISRFIWDTFSERDKALDKNINYWLIEHKSDNEDSIRDYLLQNNCIAIDIFHEDLSPYLNEESIEDIFDEKEESTAGQKALKQFFTMKEGDLVALKSTYTLKVEGKNRAVLRISAVGRITSDATDGYEFSQKYGHLLPVQWTNTEKREFIGYGGYRSVINEAKSKKTINLVFMQSEEIKDPSPLPEPILDTVPKNYIFHGPPGTGKTYTVTERAVKLIDPKIYEELIADGREAIQQEFSRLVKAGQINFVTFHQSYAYEDFIEGLKSDGNGNFIPTDGILKKAALEAMYEGIESNKHDYSGEVHFEQLYNYLVVNGIPHNVQFESKTGAASFISHISPQGNIVVTSEDVKTNSIVSKERLLNLYRFIQEHDIDWKHNNIGFIREAIGGCNQTRYWSVLNWISEKMEEEETIEIEGDEKKAVIKKALIERSSSFEFTNVKKHVVIIDEMNRGNISKIFGELLTLLEEDKRLTEKNELIVELPYSKEKFTLPPNLFIIGTMNTADRSIALLDTALRRRYVFEEMMPNADLLESIGEEIDLTVMLSIMNKRIEVLYDRDHTIGHAYFINATTDEEVISIFQTKIIPLLQDYFYDDWEKIGLVLGGIGKSKEDSYIVYKEEVDVNQLFKQKPSMHIPALYRLKRKLTPQELIAIYE
ncbi:5-methylcytosine-specific restriction enzyme B [Peribacillus simplex]|uniref:5-methylcytosine-specific restriction enzyme B n=1 Tax=Peribacillus simplex TaxID=1478 RepID=A0A9X8R1C5_9BACI|nr:AAA family ATPase [Peribacillus simplex]SIQ01308.1 5-methylcytosine-specific restriction enzyme B [Peribacillus simplex]